MIQATKENRIRTLGAKMAIAFKERYEDLSDYDQAKVFIEAVDMHAFAYKALHSKKQGEEFSRKIIGELDRLRDLVANA